MKAVAILGSTGSIGRQTLEIAESHRDHLAVVALAAGSGSLHELSKQIEAFKPELVSVPTPQAASKLSELLRGHRPEIMHGHEGLMGVATHPRAQTLVTAVVGSLGVLPTAAAIRQGKTIALANKETLVAAGSIIMPLARECQAKIVPVDSEHSAIFQSLNGQPASSIRRILLTGSGGPFRCWDEKQMAGATISDALRHPNWSMGRKITIDSATLMNKGLEIIEARWLFDVEPERITVVIHPQSILHSAVEFIDGSIVGQMGVPDMRLPIHYALFYPERSGSQQVPALDLIKIGTLTFEEPDEHRFPCLAIARAVAHEDNTLPCVLNAANEVAVEAFLDGRIAFLDIPRSIEGVLAQHKPVAKPTLEDILDSDRWARQATAKLTASLTQQKPVIGGL